MSSVLASPTPDDPARDYEQTDTRDCPHDCPGTLDRTDDELVCSTCRCRPDGTYVPPVRDVENGGKMKALCVQTRWFNPHTCDDMNRSTQSTDRDRYAHSNRMKCYGGYEYVYDETDPRGGTDHYVFDISTL